MSGLIDRLKSMVGCLEMATAPVMMSRKPMTPWEWCAQCGLEVGDRVVMVLADGGKDGVAEDGGGRTTFEITAKDDDVKTVHFGLDGVWTSREWFALHPGATYAVGWPKGRRV